MCIQEFDTARAEKIKHERFRWHNFQWLEMMTGESLYETQEIDEDCLDPDCLHTAAELYDNPELYTQIQSQLESTHLEQYQVELGHNFNIDADIDFSDYGLQEADYDDTEYASALSPKQYSMLMHSMQQEPLSMYSTSSEPRESEYEPQVYDRGGTGHSAAARPMEDYTNHPAFTVHEQHNYSNRPSTRYGF